MVKLRKIASIERGIEEILQALSEKEIKDTLLSEPDIYVQGEGKKVDVLRYCKEVGIDKFSILEYIGTNKDRLKLCLKIKTKID